MKIVRREQVQITKTRDKSYPYAITIATDYGVSTSIWLDQGTFEAFYFAVYQIKISDAPTGQAIMVTREYETNEG